MSLHSAGILLYHFQDDGLEVLLVHPGGPFWSGKDEGAWSIPKGIFEEHESALQAAKREMLEETGFAIEGKFTDLGTIRPRSNKFTMEWPRKSGTIMEFPEIDRAEWFALDNARRKIQKGQAGFIDRLLIKTAKERESEG